jgi:hypothetical protein
VPAAGRADRKQTRLQVEPALLAQQRQLHVRARSLGRLGRELRLPEGRCNAHSIAKHKQKRSQTKTPYRMPNR